MINRFDTIKFQQTLLGYLPFSPNEDQQLLIEKLGSFLSSPDERCIMLIKGYAGTGKTNMIGALAKTLPTFKWRSVLLAPTGRASKVLANYAQIMAQTIHRKIFRKIVSPEGGVICTLAENLHRNTVFIIDEASMIGADNSSNNELSYNNLLESLMEYVFSGDNCKLIFVGDSAQLPPVGTSESPALNIEYLQSAYHLNITYIELKQVARQESQSGILLNATHIRQLITENEADNTLKFKITPDVIRIQGDELEDALNTAYSHYGYNETLLITRSNKRANLFNQAVRNRIRYQEDDLNAGDLLMVVKNNYYWLQEKSSVGFIANGDTVEIIKIIKRQELYGFKFAECIVRLVDYPQESELTVMLLLDSVYSETTSITQEQQRLLYEEVMADMADEPIKGKRFAYLRQSPYYNALQVKFSYAVTCHKAQGGQWSCVFIDQGYLTKEMVNMEYYRWLYTAFTRATEKVYLINFSEDFFD